MGEPAALRRRAWGGIGVATTAAALLALPVGAPAGAPPDEPRVVLVTPDCTGNFLCPAFARALRVTGTRGRIVSPDAREEPVGSLSLIAQQDYDLVISGFFVEGPVPEVARRFPRTRFALFDVPSSATRPNITTLILRPHEAAYLAGWLAARLERRRPGPDVVGVVGGVPLPAVRDFVVGFTAGARRAAPGVTVLTGYSDDFVDPNACHAVARRQIARGAGAVFDVAGACGIGTLRAAKRAGVWAIGVDVDRASLGPHILTSAVKRYDVGMIRLLRDVRAGRFPGGRTVSLGLAAGGSGLGRISPRVPASVRVGLAGVRRRILDGRIAVPGVAPGR